MTTIPAPQSPSVDQWAILTHERRRRVLAVLAGREAISVSGLADAIDDRFDVDVARERLVVDLYHVHLPALDDGGVLTFDPEAMTVARTESPVYDGAALETGVDSEVSDALADERRRTVLLVLAASEGPLPVRTLAGRVAAGERNRSPDAIPDAVSERVELSLRHVHLPKLRQAEFVRYDRESGDVAITEPLPEPVVDLLDSLVDGGSGNGISDRRH